MNKLRITVLYSFLVAIAAMVFAVSATIAWAQPATVTQKTVPSVVSLTIDNTKEIVQAQKPVTYQIAYENLGNAILTRVMLRVFLPNEIQFVDASSGRYSAEDHALTVELDTLKPGAGSEIFMTTTVGNITVDNTNLITTAHLVYRDPATGSQQDVTAYDADPAYRNVTVATQTTEGLSAALADVPFLPNTFIGWLLVIVLFMFLILGAQKWFGHIQQTAAKKYGDDGTNGSYAGHLGS